MNKLTESKSQQKKKNLCINNNSIWLVNFLPQLKKTFIRSDCVWKKWTLICDWNRTCEQLKKSTSNEEKDRSNKIQGKQI